MSHRRIAGSEHNAAEVIGNERAHDNIEDPVGECVSEYHSGPDPFGVPMQDGGRGGCRGSGDAQRTCQSKAGKDGLRIHAAVGQRQTVGYGSEGGSHGGIVGKLGCDSGNDNDNENQSIFAVALQEGFAQFSSRVQ